MLHENAIFLGRVFALGPSIFFLASSSFAWQPPYLRPSSLCRWQDLFSGLGRSYLIFGNQVSVALFWTVASAGATVSIVVSGQLLAGAAPSIYSYAQIAQEGRHHLRAHVYIVNTRATVRLFGW